MHRRPRFRDTGLRPVYFPCHNRVLVVCIVPSSNNCRSLWVKTAFLRFFFLFRRHGISFCLLKLSCINIFMANATPNRTAPGCWFLAIDLETLLRVSTLAETYTVWIKGGINWKMIVKNASQWEGFMMKTRQLGTHKINNGVLRTTDCKILSSNTRQINDNNYIHDISFACHFKHWRLVNFMNQ